MQPDANQPEPLHPHPSPGNISEPHLSIFADGGPDRFRPYLLRYVQALPPICDQLACLYYLDGLSREQIAVHLGITPPGVDRRLKFIARRLAFMLNMPTLDPITVRTDLQTLFPEELFEFAYHFYWEHQRGGLRLFIDTTRAEAAAQLRKVMEYLKVLAGEAAANPMDDVDDALLQRRYLAVVYLKFFASSSRPYPRPRRRLVLRPKLRGR